MKKAGAVFLVFIALVLFSQTLFAESKDLKSEIYSKLKCCACDVSFDKCVCPEAKEMKAYVEALIESKAGKEEIFYKLAKKYTLNSILDKKIKADLEKRLIKEAGEKRPQIIVEPFYFNFGKVNKKQGKISKIFKVDNRGSSDLVISNIRVSCSCTTVSLKVGKSKSPYFAIAGAPKDWKQIIKPGDSGELEVVFDLAHASMTVGRQTRDVFISSNDPVLPQVVIKVEAQVTQ